MGIGIRRVLNCQHNFQRIHQGIEENEDQEDGTYIFTHLTNRNSKSPSNDGKHQAYTLHDPMHPNAVLLKPAKQDGAKRYTMTNAGSILTPCTVVSVSVSPPVSAF